jgi:hypothetical protein
MNLNQIKWGIKSGDLNDILLFNSFRVRLKDYFFSMLE